MKIFLPLTLLLACLFHLTHAQTWRWGKGGSFPTVDVTSDPNGNVYVLWAVGGSSYLPGDASNIDGRPVITHGQIDIGLTSFTCNGQYRWTKVIGGTGGDSGFGLAADTLGGIYITGVVRTDSSANVVHLDNDTTIGAYTRQSWVVIKYDTAGNYKWVRMPEPATVGIGQNSAAVSIDADGGGNLYLYARLTPGLYGGAYNATQPIIGNGNSGTNWYVLKYDKTGSFMGGTHLDIAYDNSVVWGFRRNFKTNKYYYSGSIFYNGTMTFGSTTLSQYTAFVASFNDAGNLQWLKHSDTMTTIFMMGINGKPAFDENGDVYVDAYNYNNGPSWDGQFFPTNPLGVYGFPIVMKLSDNNGSLIWKTNAYTATDVAPTTVAYTNGVVGITMDYGGHLEWGSKQLTNTVQGYNVALARFNAQTGAILTLDSIGSPFGSHEYGRVLAADKRGNFYIGAACKGTVYVGQDTVTKQGPGNAGGEAGFVAKFGSASCNCTTPVAAYTWRATNLTATFTYTGSTAAVDSIVWSFGDGQSATRTGSAVTTPVAHTYALPGTYNACVTAYSTCGNHQNCQAVRVSYMGINPLSGMEEITIFPNPATDYIRADHAAGTTAVITSMTGQALLRWTITKERQEQDIRSLPAGMYWLLLEKGSKRAAMKLVKQ